MLLSALSVVALLASSGCSSVPPELKVSTVEVEIDRPEAKPLLPNPRPLTLRDVKPTVLKPDRLPEGNDWVFIAMTPRQYEVLALNNSEMLRFICEAMWRLRYYRDELPTGKQSDKECGR